MYIHFLLFAKIFLFFLVVKVIVLAILYIANILLRREVESLKWCRRYSCISPALLGFLCLFVKSLICQQGIVKFKQEMTEKGMMKNASIRFLNILLQLQDWILTFWIWRMKTFYFSKYCLCIRCAKTLFLNEISDICEMWEELNFAILTFMSQSFAKFLTRLQNATYIIICRKCLNIFLQI